MPALYSEDFTLRELWQHRKFVKSVDSMQNAKAGYAIRKMSPSCWRWFVGYLNLGYTLNQAVYLGTWANQRGDDAVSRGCKAMMLLWREQKPFGNQHRTGDSKPTPAVNTSSMERTCMAGARSQIARAGRKSW